MSENHSDEHARKPIHVGNAGDKNRTAFTGETFSRRNLPHWQIAGATYFLTWRCAPGIILTEFERDVALAAILYWDKTRWDVCAAAVVMPDHVHVLACPLPSGEGRWPLGELMHSVKSYSAHQIARLRKAQSLSVWQDERYDRWVRDEEELEGMYAYIIGNPIKAGLVERAEAYRWLYLKPIPETT